jgi:hypothetical protein
VVAITERQIAYVEIQTKGILSMKRASISAAALTLVLAVNHPTRAQDAASQIVGVWKAVDISRKEVASGKIDKPYGEKPVAYYIYTRGGHFSWTFVAENRQKPAGAAPTDAERVELFKTMSFGTGTYKVEGDKVLYHYDSSWVQSWTGAERSGALPVFSGMKMIQISAPFKNPITGIDSINTNTFERVE